MYLFHPLVLFLILLSVVSGNIPLSAFVIPVDLPSGSTIHLDISFLDIYPSSYSVCLDTTIKDPEEMRLVSGNPEILEMISKALQEKWGLHDCRFMQSRKLTLSPSIQITIPFNTSVPELKFPSLAASERHRELCSCGSGSISISCGSGMIEQLIHSNSLDGNSELSQKKGGLFISGNLMEPQADAPVDLSERSLVPNGLVGSKNIQSTSTSTDAIIDKEAEKKNTPLVAITCVASGRSLEDQNDHKIRPVENSDAANANKRCQEEAAGQSSFMLLFTTIGSDFGGGWRSTPYELRLINQQVNFRGDVEQLALVLAPDSSQLYHKEASNSIFVPMSATLKSLVKNPDGTFTLTIPAQGEFHFNSEGQLDRSFGSDKGVSTFAYCDGKMINTFHSDRTVFSLEYDEKRVSNIKGLSHNIHLEYNDRDLLSRIYDEQDAFVCFSYDDDDDLDEIVDDSGIALWSTPDSQKNIENKAIDGAIPLIYNGFGEVFYYKNPQNIWKISYREWEDDE
jgi:hypothetical protein